MLPQGAKLELGFISALNDLMGLPEILGSLRCMVTAARVRPFLGELQSLGLCCGHTKVWDRPVQHL